MVGGGVPKKTPVPEEKTLAAGAFVSANRLWAYPAWMLVFSTVPPMNRFWIDRLTVTVELVASRLARSDWIVRLLIVTLSMPRPNEILREPEGAISMTLFVSPPTKKLLIFASSAPSTGVVLKGYSSTKVVKFVALPPIRTSPIWPVPASLPWEMTNVPPGARPELGVAPANCEGTSPVVVFPLIVLAWNRFNRPPTRNVTMF